MADFRALCNAWWDDSFTTDYIIDRTGNYKSQADCIEIWRSAPALRWQRGRRGHACGPRVSAEMVRHCFVDDWADYLLWHLRLTLESPISCTGSQARKLLENLT